MAKTAEDHECREPGRLLGKVQKTLLDCPEILLLYWFSENAKLGGGSTEGDVMLPG